MSNKQGALLLLLIMIVAIGAGVAIAALIDMMGVY